MIKRLIEILSEVRDFVQYAIGDREPVIRRFREKNERAWEAIFYEGREAAMRDVTTLGRRGELTIPKRIREFLNLKAGDRLDVSVKNKKIILTPRSLDLDAVCSTLPAPSRWAARYSDRNGVLQT